MKKFNVVLIIGVIAGTLYLAYHKGLKNAESETKADSTMVDSAYVSAVDILALDSLKSDSTKVDSLKK